MMIYRIYISGALYLGVLFSVVSGQSCSEDKVRKCISIAEPMLKDPHLIFPDNMNDINNVCRTWSNFVDCIRRYIDKCFSKLRKDQFNTAVEPPIASVHQMCSISSYQSEYLQYAGCIKSTVIEPEHCGAHYSVLVNEVSQENVRKANLCCAYHNFRSCVLLKTRLRCDGNQEEGIAARFSRQVLDKAFRFLQDQCLNYVGDTGKCASMMSVQTGSTDTMNPVSTPMNSRLGEGRSVTLESVVNNRGTNNAARGSGKVSLLDVYRAKPSDFHDSVTSPPSYGNKSVTMMGVNSQSQQWQRHQNSVKSNNVKVNDEPRADEGISRKTESSHYTPSIVENSVPAVVTPRSSSYGRGISWTTSTTSTTTRTTTPSTTTSDIPDWATNTWLTHSQELTTEEIYPAAGSFGGNNIDEPNQQGLSRNDAVCADLSSTVLASLLFAILFN